MRTTRNALIAPLLLAAFGPQLLQAQPSNPFGEIRKSDKNSTLNMHLCPKGEFAVGRDQWGDIVRVNMLKIRDWSKVPGVKKAWIMKGFEGEEGMAFHSVISEVKDVDGDGELDIFRRRSEHAGEGIERLDYDDGSVVWVSEPVGAMSGDESRLPVFDLHGNGRYCVVHATRQDKCFMLWCIDAGTGKTEWCAPFGDGVKRHAGNGQGDVVVGHFLDRKTRAVVVRDGGVLHCYDHTGKEAWTHDTGLRGGAAYAHELYRHDADGDGVEDISCHALGANVDGMFSVWNGKGERLYAISFLPSPSRRTWSDEHIGGSWSHATPGGHEGVRRQIDLDGNGRADFILCMGAWHWGSDSILFLMEQEMRKTTPCTLWE